MELLSPEGNGEVRHNTLFRGPSNPSPAPEAPGWQRDHLISQPHGCQQSPLLRCPALASSSPQAPGLVYLWVSSALGR